MRINKEIKLSLFCVLFTCGNFECSCLYSRGAVLNAEGQQFFTEDLVIRSFEIHDNTVPLIHSLDVFTISLDNTSHGT